MSITEEQIQANNFKDFYNRLKPLLGIKPVSGFTPVGTIIAVMGKTAPNNYIACNGQIVNIKDYPELARYFNEQFGSYEYFGGDGIDTFGIPDLRGEFLRGTGTNGHENQGSGEDVGTHQDATEIPNIVNDGTEFKFSSSNNAVFNKEDSSIKLNNEKWGYLASNKNTSVAGPDARKTTRPTNTSVLYCIATKNIYIDVKYDYSTDEKAIGAWIDGKTLYQRTIAFNTGPFTTSTHINIYNTSNISVKNLEGYINWSTGSSNGIVDFNFYGSADNRIDWSINDNRIIIDLYGNHFANQDGYVTIQYTKE